MLRLDLCGRESAQCRALRFRLRQLRRAALRQHCPDAIHSSLANPQRYRSPSYRVAALYPGGSCRRCCRCLPLHSIHAGQESLRHSDYRSCTNSDALPCPAQAAKGQGDKRPRSCRRRRSVRDLRISRRNHPFCAHRQPDLRRSRDRFRRGAMRCSDPHRRRHSYAARPGLRLLWLARNQSSALVAPSPQRNRSPANPTRAKEQLGAPPGRRFSPEKRLLRQNSAHYTNCTFALKVEPNLRRQSPRTHIVRPAKRRKEVIQRILVRNVDRRQS